MPIVSGFNAAGGFLQIGKRRSFAALNLLATNLKQTLKQVMIDLEKLKTLYKFGKEITLNDAQELLKSAKSVSINKKSPFWS